ncbi:type VI secretion system baseplate subunit TssG [Neisseriaceae bacterium ESL0693]|nr:type VI secretion system baseplate subunit TssG [Neisseriaceae bacterium ESL0693]
MSDHLLAGLLRHPERHQFYQFCRILARQGINLRVPGLQTDNKETLQFCAWPYLGFPAGELRRALPESAYHYTLPIVYTTFMGLTGTDGAMPNWLIAQTAQKSDAMAHLNAFLDIFHHRQMMLFYQIWQRYYYEFQYTAAAQDKISTALLTLVQGRRPVPVDPRYYLGTMRLLNKKHKNALGLIELVRYVLPTARRVEINQFMPVARAIPQLTLKQQPVLGEAVLGRFMYDANSQIGIRVTLDDYQSLHDLYAGQPIRQILADLVKKYVGLALDVTLTAQIALQFLPFARLNAAEPQLLSSGVKLGAANGDTMMSITLGEI